MLSVLPNVDSKRWFDKWRKAMEQVFDVVRLIDIDYYLKQQCSTKEIETIRDAVRFVIQRCPYPQLREPPPKRRMMMMN